jgi:DNA-binding transcriptional ArsR family regulator
MCKNFNMRAKGASGPTRWITRVGQIAALSTPIRQDIVDTIDALGTCSVAELATVLGRPADSLYYHVKALRRAGLIMVAVTERGGRSEMRLSIDGHPSIRYQPAQSANREVVLRVVSAMLRNARRQFARGFRQDVAVVQGAYRNLWAGRIRGSLSRNDLHEVNRLLTTLIRTFRRPRPTEPNLYELTFVLAPTRMRRRRS